MSQVLFFSCKHYEVVNENQTDVDLKQNCNEGQPVDVLSVELDKIYLISVFFLFVIIAILGPSKGTLNLGLKNECPSWKNVAVKWHDLDEKPAVDAGQLDGSWVHLEILRIEDRVLILENGYRVEELLQHIHLFSIAH